MAGVRVGIAFSLMVLLTATGAFSEEPLGKGMTEANKERLALDDMQDVGDWQNGSPDETRISASGTHGRRALLFANTVDHTKGEKNYPVGWPRVRKDLRRAKRTDWTAYDFFECSVYVETSRQGLPAETVGIGFYHSGAKRSTPWPLKDLPKDRWVQVVVPINKLQQPDDVQAVQFHIAESNYKHGDRVDFYIADVALTRFVEPAVAELALQRALVYSNERTILATFRLVGRKGMDEARVELAIGQQADAAAKTTAAAARQGEIELAAPAGLPPGGYWARLSVRDGQGRLLDRKETPFRVIRGPLD